MKAKHKDRAVCEGSVEFQNVSFRYYKNSPEWVIENISFKLEAGKTLGIIGSTGSGKSTLVSMIPRLYDTDEGTVLVDGIMMQGLRFKAFAGRHRYGAAKQYAFFRQHH